MFALARAHVLPRFSKMRANLPAASRLNLACRLNASIASQTAKFTGAWGGAPYIRRFFLITFSLSKLAQGRANGDFATAERRRFASKLPKSLAAPSDKEKVAMEVEKLHGYSRFEGANSLPAFLFDTRGAKRKANKRETPFYVGAAHTR